MPTLRYVVVDVFTDTPLAGNQLAVFTDARELDAELMQALALEIGFSETTFVLPAGGGRHTRASASSTRAHEMPFAGHPDARHRVGARGATPARRSSSSRRACGIVPVELDRDESGALVFGRMVQPVPTISAVDDTEALFDALGVRGSELPVELYDNGATHIVVTLGSDAAVAALSPDPSAIARFGVTGVNCISGAESRWKSRMFWPRGEDAATGSAAGPIACHLQPPWAGRVGRVDRDLAGRRDRPSVDALRARRRR